MNRKQERDAALKSAREIVERAKNEERELTPEEAESVDALLVKADSLGVEIKKADEMAERFNRLAAITHPEEDAPGTSAAKSLGEFFIKTVGSRLAAVKDSGTSRWSVSSPEFKANTDVQMTPAAGFGLAPLVTDFDRTFVTGVRRRLTVADLMSQGTISGNALTYFIEGAAEGAFTTVDEGAVKPQVHFADGTPVTEALTKIAAYIKESDEVVEDFPFLVSSINNRLLYMLGLFEENQLLAGTGAGTDLIGLLNRSGIQTHGAIGGSAGDNPDLIFEAITKVATGSGLDADGIVVNPTDYQAWRLLKDSNDQYFGGGFFQGAYGVDGFSMQPPMWGLRTVVTPAITAGTVLVGAFAQAAQLYRKGGVRVETTNSNENDFIYNRITILAEERLLLAVRRPAGLVKVTLGAAA